MKDANEIKNNRILVIDDNPAIHEDIRKILCADHSRNAEIDKAKALLFDEAAPEISHAEFTIDSAYQGEEGLRKVREACQAGRPFALAFVDVRMPPGWDGVETITHIWKDHPDLQVVICTAYSDYSWEQMVQHLGKSDSMLILKKPFDNIEVLQLAHALTEKWTLSQEVKCRLNNLDALVSQRTTELLAANEKLKEEIAERLVMEDALRLSEERFSKAFRASPIPLAIQSFKEEKLVDANEGFQLLTGYSREELIGHTPEQLNLWFDPDEKNAMLRKLHNQMAVHNLPCRFRAKSGVVRDVLLSVELFELDGEPFLLIISQDITEQIKLESQLRQAQKMEAIGQLAAGVAHDFNNILTVIQGNASLLLMTRTPESKEHKPLKTICEAADRAGRLVRQLLTFSRKQFLQLRPMDVRTSLRNVADLLPRILGEHISITIPIPSTLSQVNADAGMVEQLLLNLAVNARDAMPKGGTLKIEAEEINVGIPDTRRNPDARPGLFICLIISDTGTGIAPEILPRIFEPFFTTKPVGKGTGLGLATVYGIAKQHGGWIEVQSQPGQGATFKVFIPVSEQKTGAEPVSLTLTPPQGGREIILVVEDEDDVRDFVVEVLKSQGYNVLSAASGPQAVEMWSQHKQRIDLLLTDMVMPGGLTGRELAARLLAQDPQLRIVYTSGYSPGMAGKDLDLLEGRNFLAKPYRPDQLLYTIRDCLNRPIPASPVVPA